MNRELARKRPAQIVDIRPYVKPVTVGGQTRTIVRSHNRTAVMQVVNGMYERGQIQREFRLAKDDNNGEWVAVTFASPPRRWLRRNGGKLALCIVVPVALAVGAVTAYRALPPQGVALAVLAAIVLLARPRAVISVIQSVTIRR